MKSLTRYVNVSTRFSHSFHSSKKITGQSHNSDRKPVASRRVLSLLLLLTAIPLHQAWAGNPFNIDGLNIGDSSEPPLSDIVTIPDPYGSVQELGAINGNTTKLGVIHTAPLPMLDFTNPNGQTDLRTIWLATAKDTVNDDIWLYFAWERDASSGSSVVAYEFQEAAPPDGCLYTDEIDYENPETQGETDLIEACNPWSLRANGDFMIVWDFKGGATEIVLRTFDGIAFDSQLLDAEEFKAALSGDTSMGEGAINLSQTIFPSTVTECRSVGNVITGTITGNSDSADYKDTVLADVSDKISISNCGEVVVKKMTVGEADGTKASFDFESNLQLLPPTSNSFSLSNGDQSEFDKVKAPITGYWVKENDPGQDFVLTDLKCTKNGTDFPAGDLDLTLRQADFDLDRSDKVSCTFTNSRKPQVRVKKELVPSTDGGTFNLSIGGTNHATGVGDGGDTGFQYQAIGAKPIVAEVAAGSTVIGNYESSISCDNGQTKNGTSIQLNELKAGDDITCTITNKLKPRVKVIKTLIPSSDGGTFDLSIGGTKYATSVGDGGDTGFQYQAIDSTPVVAESAAGSAILGNYESSISCDNGQKADDTSIQVNALKAGEDVICTITNKLKPQVRVQKVLIPSDDGGTFDLSIGGTDHATGIGDGGDTGFKFQSIGATPVVAEAAAGSTVLGDYVTSISCDNEQTANVASLQLNALKAGDKVVCTITNKRKPRVKVVKALVPSTDGGTFDLSIGGNTHATGVGNGGNTGFKYQAIDSTPTVAEFAAAGTDLSNYVSSISCSNGQSADATSLQLNALKAGDAVTCTITNKRQPTLSIQKICKPAGDTGLFNLLIDGKGSSNSACGATYGPVVVSIGSHTISETAGSGTDLDHYTQLKGGDCGADGVIIMAAGDVKTCTITNTVKTGAIRITKTRKFASAASGDPNDQPHPGVTFEISGGSLASPVTVTTGDDGIACYDGDSENGIFLAYSAKTSDYSVKEIVPVGYDPDNGTTVTPGKPDGSVTYAKSVTIDQEGTCSSGYESVGFTNSPLTNVKVTAAAIDPGATKSNIECYRGSQDIETDVITIGDPIPGAGDDSFNDSESVELNNQLPQWPNELIVCTIKIDP